MNQYKPNLDDPTWEEIQFVLALRGGCRCTWPNASPPCTVCTDPWDQSECEAVIEEFTILPETVDYMKHIRDLCK